MWAKYCDENEVQKLLQGEAVFDALSRSLQQLELGQGLAQEYLVIWKDEPKHRIAAPAMIIGEAIPLEKLLAWSSTYVSELDAFTAYCRACTPTEASRWLGTAASPSLPISEGVVVGITVAEMCLRSPSAVLNETSPNSLMWMLSFALGRAFAVGYGLNDLDVVVELWERLQRSNLPRHQKDVTAATREVWRILAEGLSKDRSEKSASKNAAMHALLQADDHDSATVSEAWNTLSKDVDVLGKARDSMVRNREERVKALELTLERIDDEMLKNTAVSMCVGYLCNLVAPGTFRHVGLLDAVRNKAPSALLWYGVFAGRDKASKIALAFGGIGLRLLREVLRSEDPFSAPRADVSIRELAVLERTPRGVASVKANIRDFHSVELLPGVAVNATIGAERPKPQAELFPSRAASKEIDQLAWKLTDAARAIRRDADLIEAIRDELRGAQATLEEKKGRQRKPGRRSNKPNK